MFHFRIGIFQLNLTCDAACVRELYAHSLEVRTGCKYFELELLATRTTTTQQQKSEQKIDLNLNKSEGRSYDSN